MGYTLYIIAVPLVLFLVLGLGTKALKPRLAGLLGTAGMAVAALLSYRVTWEYFSGRGMTDGIYQKIIAFSTEWLRFSDQLHIDMGVLLDPISVVLFVVITTVSLAVHVYSMGYMKGERGFQRYYAFLSLFSFSMLGLVAATNIFQMYIFWELVGVSSYLLIGFYYTRPEAVSAAKKAFIITRFADLGFLIGILVLSFYSGTFDFGMLTAGNAELAVNSMAGGSFLGLSAATWAMSLIFLGAAGKSAMFPLHVWLPDAMEGPTPVSALIHAATMVVAGVFLVARMLPVYVFAAPDVLTLITYVGTFTALFAAVIAITQTDIKRVLAFSTISQIAYMMVALGVSGYGGEASEGYTASMFHLFTHAFFKALLFLGAGAVIHAVRSNEMADMGNLRRYMPVTHIAFLVACLSIAGIPPFSGFFSKDEILVATYAHDKVLFYVLWLVSGLTAFYMFRLYYGIFWGAKGDYEHTPHEAPPTMLVPITVLAVLTCLTGFVPFGQWVSSDGVPTVTRIDWGIAAASIAVAVIGILLATMLYARGGDKPARIAAKLNGLYRATRNRFYIDEVWQFVAKKVIFRWVGEPAAWFDRHMIDGALNGLARGTEKLAESIKGVQSGQVQTYAAVFVVSVLAITAAVLFL